MRSKVPVAARAASAWPAGPVTVEEALEAEAARLGLLIEAVTLHREGRTLPETRRAALAQAQAGVAAVRATGVFAPLLEGVDERDRDLACDSLLIVAYPLARPSRARTLSALAGAGATTDGGVAQGLIHELLMPDGALEMRLTRVLGPASPLLRGGLLRAEGEGPGRLLRPGIRLARFMAGSEAAATPPEGVRLAYSPGDPLQPLHLSAATRRRLDEVAALVLLLRSRPGIAFGGPSVLFTGGPGTGKSLAVLHLAARLACPLYEIELGRVISKWVGETERNLSRIFDELSGTHGAVVANEADAILGKRVEVRDGRDHYANVTVSHLLALLERHRGPVFLTTNLRANLDSAYLRRFAAVVEFRRPDARLRAAIWRDALVRAVPGIDPETVDPLVRLAAPIEASAAEIVNICMTAAALSTGSAPEPADLARAVWLEMTKAGLTFTRSDLGPLAPFGQEDPLDA